MHKRRLTAAVITGTTVLATAVVATNPASAAPTTKSVARTKPAWTTHARHLGRRPNP